MQRENPYRVKAYHRAAADVDLTVFPSIGTAIAGAVHEIVTTGTVRQLEALRAQATSVVGNEEQLVLS
jgi:DNA polymerase/3'-5' exonuclease PolX